MPHISQEKLSALITEAQTKISIGSKYCHYKNPDQHYEIIAVGMLESEEKPCVVYKALYEKEIIWVRDIDNFLEEIDTPEGKVKRFSLVKK